jgi:tellurite resistance protein/uncharacterized protein (DUF697 family)
MALSSQDASTILAIASLAAIADGQRDDAEQARLIQTAAALGLTNAAETMAQVESGALTLPVLASRLTDAEARQLAYDTAAAVCHADGWINPNEGAFLRQLAAALQADTSATDRIVADVNRATDGSATTDAPSDIDRYILDQAIVTAGLEILPDRLANLGILPLQLRMVQQIGARHGQQLDLDQVKDLAATLGIGAAAQLLESVVRRTFGGLAGGLLGGALGSLIGGTAGSVAGLASGAAVTFATTYALGHVAQQYYAQGRSLSTADLKGLFTRLRAEGETMFPRVEARVRDAARSGSLTDILRSVTR